MYLHRHVVPLAALTLLGFAGCTAGNGAVEPGFTSSNLTQNKLRLAVGVATFADGSHGINAVATFRQPNGLSATLLNTPTFSGPFTVPAATSAGTDAGTSRVTGSPQALPGATAAVTTFGQTGGVFSYGFAPENSTTSGGASYALYTKAFYGATDLTGNPSGVAYRGGPPAYPNVRDGTYPAGFYGYTLGFTTFAMAPVAGTYNLSVNIPSGNAPSVTLAAPPASLASVAGLPAIAAPPSFTPDGNGGGTASCTTPTGVTETIVEIVDSTAPAYYTFVAPGGATTETLAPNLGPSKPGSTAPSIVAGDTYNVECIGVDYPLFEAGPPANLQQTPTLTGAAGQSDITFSPPFSATY